MGNTLANLVAVSLAAGMLEHWLGRWPWARLAMFLVVVFYFYILCELLPKIVFRAFPNRLCLKFVGVFRRLHLVLRPLDALVAWLSRLMLSWTGGRRFTGKVFVNRDELRFIMQESAQGLTVEERAMINPMCSTCKTSPSDRWPSRFTPANSTRAGTPISEVLAFCRARNLNRVPVWDAGGKPRPDHRHPQPGPRCSTPRIWT